MLFLRLFFSGSANFLAPRSPDPSQMNTFFCGERLPFFEIVFGLNKGLSIEQRPGLNVIALTMRTQVNKQIKNKRMKFRMKTKRVKCRKNEIERKSLN